MLSRLREVRLEPATDAQGYKLDLTGAAGTLVIPYHFGRWFKVTLDGHVVDEPEGLGLCIVGVAPQNKVLEIRPQREGIVKRTLAGLLVGCVLAVFGSYLCVWLPRRSLLPEEVPPRPDGPQPSEAKPHDKRRKQSDK